MSNGDVIKPDVSPELAKDISKRLYGITPTNLKERNSYDDRNFVVSDQDGNKRLLKVTNITDSNETWRIEFQNAVMKHLTEAGVPVQVPLPSINKQLIEFETIETRLNQRGDMGKRKHAVRLLSYIPGCVLDDQKVRVDANLLFNVGKMVANVSLCLTDLPSTYTVPSSDILWSLMSVPRLREFVYAVREEEDRQLILKVVERFEQEVVPELNNLRQGIAYGDPNEQNILVRETVPSTSPPTFEIAGLLDWQEVHRAPIVADLGMLCAHMMASFKSTWDSELDEFSLCRHCVNGFNSVWRLTDLELRVLPILVMGRYAQFLCLGAYKYYELDPTNDYLLVTAANGWRQLRALSNMNRRDLLKMLTEITIK